MIILPGWAIALSGGLIGFAVGFAARRGRLCTLGAIEDAYMGGNFRRLKVLAVALGLALILTQLLVIHGLLVTETVRYLPERLPWLGILTGGLLFGVGMALCGTCAFGTLVRLGGGDLRALVVLLVFALTALATLRGAFAGLRVDHLETLAIQMPGGVQSDLAALVSWAFGFDMRLIVVAGLSAALLLWGLWRGALLETPRLLLSGVVLGAGVAAGWYVTSALADDFALVVQPVSLTFVSPVADAIQLAIAPSSGMLEFGVASVAGVLLGALAAAFRYDEFRWESYDDHREMKRHLVGAALMGFGGVLAGGCTIGQGLTAGSVLAISWFLAVAGMVAGARLGLFYLVEGQFMMSGGRRG